MNSSRNYSPTTFLEDLVKVPDYVTLESTILKYITLSIMESLDYQGVKYTASLKSTTSETNTIFAANLFITPDGKGMLSNIVEPVVEHIEKIFKLPTVMDAFTKHGVEVYVSVAPYEPKVIIIPISIVSGIQR